MKKYVIGIILLLTVVFAGCLEGDMDFTSNDTQFSIDGLVGHWSFDEGNGNVVYDYSGNDNTGSIFGATWVEGILGSALSFDGVDDYIEISNTPEFNSFTQLTTSSWIYINGFDVWEPILNKGELDDHTTDVFEININSEGLVHFVLNFESSGRQGFNSPSNSISAGYWYHIVTLYDGDYAKIYINGVLISEYDAPNEPLKYSDATLQIGLEYGSPPESYFNGMIDEVYIFNRAIDESEVGQLYNLSVVGKQIAVTYCDFDDITYEISSLLSSYDEDEIIIIMGSNLDFEDRALFLLASSQIDELKNIRLISDSEVNSTEDLDEKAVILIGSEKTNIVSEELINKNKLNISKTLVSSSYVVVLGSDENNKTTLMFFTTKEFYNKENKAAEKSPLSAIIDKKYIPVVATATSIILLYL